MTASPKAMMAAGGVARPRGRQLRLLGAALTASVVLVMAGSALAQESGEEPDKLAPREESPQPVEPEQPSEAPQGDEPEPEPGPEPGDGPEPRPGPDASQEPERAQPVEAEATASSGELDGGGRTAEEPSDTAEPAEAAAFDVNAVSDVDAAFAEMESFDEPDESADSETVGAHLHGSFENQLTALWLRRSRQDDRLSLHDYTRLRIDVDADLPQGVQLRSDAVARLFVGETAFDLVDLVPKRTVDQLTARDSRWDVILNDDDATFDAFEDELYIDNAYLKVPAGPVLISVGKQPLEQGAGYVWNPTDVFTVKDLFDPTYEKPGVIALRTTIAIADIASLDLMAAPEGEFEKWSAGGRASVRIGSLSFGPAAYVTRVERTELEASLDDMGLAASFGVDPLEAVPVIDTRRVMVGGDAVLDIQGVRLWAEGAHNFVSEKQRTPDDWWELSAGVEYFFSFETHLMAEYYHYGRGPTQRDGAYDLNAWMGLLQTELKMLGRDFAFVSVDHPVADFWTAGIASIQSFTDLSATVMADVKWDFIQDGELWLLVAGNPGEHADFLSSSPGQAWFRLKVFF